MGSTWCTKISEPLDRAQDPQLDRAGVVINDVQWADATTLELLDYLLAPGHASHVSSGAHLPRRVHPDADTGDWLDRLQRNPR